MDLDKNFLLFYNETLDLVSTYCTFLSSNFSTSIKQRMQYVCPQSTITSHQRSKQTRQRTNSSKFSVFSFIVSPKVLLT